HRAQLRWFLAIYSPSPDAAVAAAAAADWTPQAARSAGEEPDLSPPPLPSVPATSLRAPLTLKGLNMAGLLLRRFIGIQPRAPMTAAGGAALFYASCPSSPRTVAHLEVRGEQAAAEAELSKKSCIPCNSKDLHAMSEDSAKKSLEQVTGWELKNEGDILKLHRAWKVKNFVKGLEFFQLVAAVAEEEGHHPDLHLVSWNNVKIDVWTHSVRGLTDNDFILAAKINELKLEGLLSKKKATSHE
uniref:4a-hydroxytetrahydrobiopterin dehydratase n=5 Tax=Triticinae TaxID=1648030 RepID=A0A453F6G0_AEGTS